LAYPSADWERAGTFYRGAWTLGRRPVAALCRVEAKGVHHVPLEGPVLFASNHWSYCDPILLLAVLPRPVQNLAKAELFRTRLGSWFFGRVGQQIPVERAAGAGEPTISRAVDALAEGRAVAIFPEGTISEAPDLLPAKTGVARIALASGAPVLPVGIVSDQFWPRGRRVPRLGARNYVAIGEPLRFGRQRDPPSGAELRERSDHIMQAVRALVDEGWQARERGETWGRPRTYQV
jgi:1-acyl-sn-glycerol-3-phosphate acyltransferase